MVFFCVFFLYVCVEEKPQNKDKIASFQTHTHAHAHTHVLAHAHAHHGTCQRPKGAITLKLKYQLLFFSDFFLKFFCPQTCSPCLSLQPNNERRFFSFSFSVALNTRASVLNAQIISIQSKKKSERKREKNIYIYISKVKQVSDLWPCIHSLNIHEKENICSNMYIH